MGVYYTVYCTLGMHVTHIPPFISLHDFVKEWQAQLQTLAIILVVVYFKNPITSPRKANSSNFKHAKKDKPL